MQKIKKLIPLGLTLGLMFVPLIVGAQTGDANDLINKIREILIRVIPLLIGIAVIVFLVGIIRYITAGEDEEKRRAGRNMMIYGIIGLFVMVSVWGLVNILTETFDTNVSGDHVIPDLFPNR